MTKSYAKNVRATIGCYLWSFERIDLQILTDIATTSTPAYDQIQAVSRPACLLLNLQTSSLENATEVVQPAPNEIGKKA